MNNFAMLYTTWPSAEAAQKVIELLLEKKLIACANIIPVTSMYRWQGKIMQEAELVVIFKTAQASYDLLVKEIVANHSYETPCIIRLEARANEPFEKWVQAECGL